MCKDQCLCKDRGLTGSSPGFDIWALWILPNSSGFETPLEPKIAQIRQDLHQAFWSIIRGPGAACGRSQPEYSPGEERNYRWVEFMKLGAILVVPRHREICGLGPRLGPIQLSYSPLATTADNSAIHNAAEDTVLAWIIPPVDSWETDNFGSTRDWDTSPFFAGRNVLTMQTALLPRRRSLSHGPCTAAPPHAPRHTHHDAATDHFLRIHCRYSLNLMLRGGNISEDYPDRMIRAKLDEPGVPYVGCGHAAEREMVPLGDARGKGVLGKAILEDWVCGRTESGYNAAPFDAVFVVIPYGIHCREYYSHEYLLLLSFVEVAKITCCCGKVSDAQDVLAVFRAPIWVLVLFKWNIKPNIGGTTSKNSILSRNSLQGDRSANLTELASI
ncbi:hypothetical protein B0H17DRAFT_1146689 [Mycena rosella]|uniref:Uncharacterized protein n=1 Tax=Mycena rosella TaxID=1033263 RepID=A0AAD7CNF3_MYCRO|nr:hypothetical protein B0H17DRAFT_1146689 [Mycena rosella]